MDFINQFFAQVRDLLASMTPAARITSALLLGVIVISLGYLFQGYGGATESFLFNGEILESGEANRVEAAIAKANLKVFPRNAGRIVVPRGEEAAYLAAVADAGALPANFDTLLDESLDGGLFESAEVRRARIKAARERKLSMIVSMMEGIDYGKVLYDIREPKGFEQQQTTATVSVMPESDVPLDGWRMRKIRAAVAGAIAGLDPKSVTITNMADGSQYGFGGEAADADFDDPYFQTRIAYEQRLKAKIEDLLRFIQPGALVEVSAELDESISTEVRTLKAEGDPAAIRERTDTTELSSTQSEDRGEPGLVAQGPNRTGAQQQVVKNQTTDSRNTTETESFVPKTEELRRQAGLVPTRVHAAIAVPSEYLVRVWRETDPSAKPDQKPTSAQLTQIQDDLIENKIKPTVARLFPKELAEFALDNVEVTVFQSLPREPEAKPSLASLGMAWAGQNASSITMVALALASLAMLRSMIRSIPPADRTVKFAEPSSPEASDAPPRATAKGEEAEKRDASRPKLRLKKGPTLKDDLVEMVREDPDGAAAILKTWIGNAA
ncbi:MAG: hypothetical protein DCC67_08640 [Planctomycetota bacterium]|nr:MAG: hypothetical protein DCC67_08640 [Planctomycetota bacterium]